MNINLVHEIIGYTQNLGSSEDVITACLATAFHYCPGFTELFFHKIGINDFPWKDENGEKYDYTSDTGFRINGMFGPKIDFKPDIVIGKLDEWTDKSQLKNEHLILIESKLGAALEKKQKQSYQLFKSRYLKEFPDRIKLVLISLKKEKSDVFDLNLSWFEVIKIFKEIIRSFDDWSSEKLILKEILEFMKISLIPSKNNLKNDKKVYCPKSILKELKNRTDFSSARPKKHKISEKLQSCRDFEQIIKVNGLDSKSPMSYIDISENSVKRYLFCAVWQKKVLFWAAHIDGKEKCDVLGDIRLNSSAWVDDWFDVLSKVCSL